MTLLDEYSGALQSLGSDLRNFLENLGSVYQEMRAQCNTTNAYEISFSCVPEQSKLTLHLRSVTAACGYVWAGILKSIATYLFRVAVTIQVTLYELKTKSSVRYHFCFTLPTDGLEAKQSADSPCESNGHTLYCADTDAINVHANGREKQASNTKLLGRKNESTVTVHNANCFSQYIGIGTFCRAFPWHFMIDRHLQLVQLGSGFMRLFGSDLKEMGCRFYTYFDIKKPKIDPDFQTILKRANIPFILVLRHVTGEARKVQLQVSANYSCHL